MRPPAASRRRLACAALLCAALLLLPSAAEGGGSKDKKSSNAKLDLGIPFAAAPACARGKPTSRPLESQRWSRRPAELWLRVVGIPLRPER